MCGWGCNGLGVGKCVVWVEQRCNGCGTAASKGRGRGAGGGGAWIGEGSAESALVLRGFQEAPNAAAGASQLARATAAGGLAPLR